MSLDISRRRFGAWVGAVLLLVGALVFFAWSGSSADPRSAAPWTWTTGGWVVPAPGIGALWIASATVSGVLSGIAWFLFNPVERAKTIKPWASAIIILGLAIGIRVVVVWAWMPLPLAAGGISGPLQRGLGGRSLAAGSDMVVVGLLLLALAGARRSLWWAALYALHPLTLVEVAGNGHFLALGLMPLIFVAGLAHRFGQRMRMLMAATAAAAAVAALVAACRHSGFNSLALELAWAMRLPAIVALPIAEILAQSVVLAIAWRRSWPLTRTLAHVLLALLIVSPVVEPWYVLPVVALIPLAWTPAGWVLSMSVLGAYMVVPIARSGGHWQVPAWWLAMEWVPVVMLEAQELWRAMRGGRCAEESDAPVLTPGTGASD